MLLCAIVRGDEQLLDKQLYVMLDAGRQSSRSSRAPEFFE